MNTVIEPPVVSIRRARVMLGDVSRSTIYNLVARGVLDLRKVGERSTITTASIHRCLGMAEAA